MLLLSTTFPILLQEVMRCKLSLERALLMEGDLMSRGNCSIPEWNWGNLSSIASSWHGVGFGCCADLNAYLSYIQKVTVQRTKSELGQKFLFPNPHSARDATKHDCLAQLLGLRLRYSPQCKYLDEFSSFTDHLRGIEQSLKPCFWRENFPV